MGLYRGIGPAMVRTACGSSVQLPTYFLAKRTIQKHGGLADGTPLHLLSSTCSGFVVCIAMNPSKIPRALPQHPFMLTSSSQKWT